MLLAPLNRPSHYLKPRDGRPDVESWLNAAHALSHPALAGDYRRPRPGPARLSATTTASSSAACKPSWTPAWIPSSGVRGTPDGAGHAHQPRPRLRRRQPGRRHRQRHVPRPGLQPPRLCSSGPAIRQPDVVGLFLLPAVDRNRTRTLTLGNACAALRELQSLRRPRHDVHGQVSQTRAGAVRIASRRLSAASFCPCPKRPTSRPYARRSSRPACFWHATLFAAGPRRRPGPRRTDRHSVGIARPVLPDVRPLSACPGRATSAARVARRLCQRLVQRWMSKDSKPIREVRARLGAGAMDAAGTWLQRADGTSWRWLPSGSRPGTRGNVPRPRRALLQRHAAAQRSQDRRRGRVAGRRIDRIARAIRATAGQAARRGAVRDAAARGCGAVRDSRPARAGVGPETGGDASATHRGSPTFAWPAPRKSIRQMVASIEQALQHHEPLSQGISSRAAEIVRPPANAVGRTGRRESAVSSGGFRKPCVERRRC